MCLKPGRRQAQYSAPRKRQWSCGFTVLSSAGKSAALEKGPFSRRRRAPQHAIAMRETPEPADDVGVILGVFQIVGVAGLAEEFDATKLVGQMLRMHERHVEKLQQCRLDARVGAAGDGAADNLAGQRIAWIAPDIATKHVAW